MVIKKIYTLWPSGKLAGRSAGSLDPSLRLSLLGETGYLAVGLKKIKTSKRGRANRAWNLAGIKFGKLTVASNAGFDGKYQRWNCKCECGKSVVARAGELMLGRKTACSAFCARNLSGKTIGRFLVLGKIKRPSNIHGHGTYFECRCLKCGTVSIKPYGHIKEGRGCATCRRVPTDHAALTILFQRYKSGAAKRGFEFSLTRKQVGELIKRRCVYCDSLPWQVQKTKTSQFLYMGIDRKDSSIGYVTRNVVPCCKTCNRKKGSMRIDEFASWINKVHAMLRKNFTRDNNVRRLLIVERHARQQRELEAMGASAISHKRS